MSNMYAESVQDMLQLSVLWTKMKNLISTDGLVKRRPAWANNLDHCS